MDVKGAEEPVRGGFQSVITNSVTRLLERAVELKADLKDSFAGIRGSRPAKQLMGWMAAGNYVEKAVDDAFHGRITEAAKDLTSAGLIASGQVKQIRDPAAHLIKNTLETLSQKAVKLLPEGSTASRALGSMGESIKGLMLTVKFCGRKIPLVGQLLSAGSTAVAVKQDLDHNDTKKARGDAIVGGTGIVVDTVGILAGAATVAVLAPEIIVAGAGIGLTAAASTALAYGATQIATLVVSEGATQLAADAYNNANGTRVRGSNIVELGKPLLKTVENLAYEGLEFLHRQPSSHRLALPSGVPELAPLPDAPRPPARPGTARPLVAASFSPQT